VAAALAVTDHASQAVFSKALGRPLAFATNPGAFVAHTFFFIFTGVTAYVAVDAMYNPLNKGKEVEALKSGTYSSYIGSCTAWFEPYVAPTVARLGAPVLAGSWLGSSLLPATLAYSTVKGVGWFDWSDAGLTEHEKKMTYPDDQCKK
jgi:hypothetical protein